MSKQSKTSAWTIVWRVIVGLGFTAAVVLLLLWLAGVFHKKIGADHGRPAGAPGRYVKNAEFRVVRLTQEPVFETAVGTIRPVYQTSVASKLPVAKVVAVDVHAGQDVNQGDLLVQLDDEDLRARLKQTEATVAAAEAARDQARIEYDRIRGLYERGSAARIEFERADTDLRAAQAELDRAGQARREAETVLGYATIRSPLTGQVVDKNVEVGDTVRSGELLLTLYDRMQLVANVRESLAQELQVGQKIPVDVPAMGKLCTGQISEIVPQAEAASRTFQVKVTGPCPKGIIIGMFGRLKIPRGEEDVLRIPLAAVRRVGQLDIVDVAVPGEAGPEGRRVRRRAVQLGGVTDDGVEVLAGLTSGEEIVVGLAR